MAVVVMNANCPEQRGGGIEVDNLALEQAKALKLMWVAEEPEVRLILEVLPISLLKNGG